MRKNSHKILGVDPGTNFLGFAILEVSNGNASVIDLGELKLKKLPDQQNKLKEIFLQVQEIVEYHLPACMAIEAPFFGKNPQSMLKLGRAQGVAIAAGITMGLDITEYSPRKIKQSVTGNGNASKEQVAAMLVNILGKTILNKSYDATDALAVALCHHFQAGNTQPNGVKYNNWKKFLTDNPERLRKG